MGYESILETELEREKGGNCAVAGGIGTILPSDMYVTDKVHRVP